MYSMRFNMRAPDFGAAPTELYEAAVDMCAWAETRGCLAAVLCEHHGSPDGYLPTPMILASAIAARTKQLMMTLIVILPFYEPVRLAKKIAVLDILSKGRASYVFGLGYRPEEFEHFGLDLRARGRMADEKLGLLRRLLAGEAGQHHGRPIKVAAPPLSPAGRRGGAPRGPPHQSDAAALFAGWSANDVGWRKFGSGATRRPLRAWLSRTGRRARFAGGVRGRLSCARSPARYDAAAQSRYPERVLRRPGRRPRLAGDRTASAARRARICRVEPRKSDIGGDRGGPGCELAGGDVAGAA